jgi:hypothetical protein
MLVYTLFHIFRFNFVFIFLFAFEGTRYNKVTHLIFNLLSLGMRVEQSLTLQDAYLKVIL